MALFQVDYYSNALARITCFHLILPNDTNPEMISGNDNYKRGMKTLYLLHGYSGSSKDWLMGSLIQELALKYNLAVVMPSGENSFYLDGKGTGRAYCKYVGQELVEYLGKTFGLSREKDDNIIGGFSMGGFGAIHTGLAYPNTFGKIIALSSALIVNKIKDITENFSGPMADYDYYVGVFGDLKRLEESVNNPEYLVRSMKNEKKAIPGIYMACGTEDLLLEDNRAFHKFLLEQKIEAKYKESPGMHNWEFWNQYLEPGIIWALDE